MRAHTRWWLRPQSTYLSNNVALALRARAGASERACVRALIRARAVLGSVRGYCFARNGYVRHGCGCGSAPVRVPLRVPLRVCECEYECECVCVFDSRYARVYAVRSKMRACGGTRMRTIARVGARVCRCWRSAPARAVWGMCDAQEPGAGDECMHASPRAQKRVHVFTCIPRACAPLYACYR